MPSEYKQLYKRHYAENRNGRTVASSASQRMERWLHKQVACDTNYSLVTLEIGAGTLNQLKYEKSEKYDIIEPFKELFVNSEELSRVRNVYDLMEDVPLSNQYNRIISCAVLEHIDNLPLVISKSGLLLAENGCLRASVPSEGGFLWRLGYTLTTGLEFKLRYHLDYSVIIKHEHLNSVDEIEEIIRWFYHDVKIKRFGISKHLSLYTFFCARHPNIERCKDYYQDYCSN